jgi:polyferredoxin
MHQVQKQRLATQVFFAGLCVWIGVEFALWLRAMENSDVHVPSRPPGVEAFLPISSLMNASLWAQTGELQMFHPAGVFIFLGIVAASFFLGKFFCSFMCPVGFFSEFIWKAKTRFFNTAAVPVPVWLDFSLRGIKYLLLGFFVFVIFGMMDAQALREFLDSPYNLAADAKMFDFFANISKTSAIVIAIIVLFSLIVRNAWCRFLCPYGALLGLVGLLSPSKIKRETTSCINCEKCTRVCPAGISVHTTQTVVSDECSSCLACVSACPVPNTLSLKLAHSQKSLPWKWMPVVALTIYGLFILWGVVSKRWQNSADFSLYQSVIQHRKSLGHPGQTGEYTR